MYEEIRQVFVKHKLYLLIDDDLEVDDIITDIIAEVKKDFE